MTFWAKEEILGAGRGTFFLCYHVLAATIASEACECSETMNTILQTSKVHTSKWSSSAGRVEASHSIELGWVTCNSSSSSLSSSSLLSSLSNVPVKSRIFPWKSLVEIIVQKNETHESSHSPELTVTANDLGIWIGFFWHANKSTKGTHS